MILLTAPIDMQDGPEYELALKMLVERYGPEHVKADRDLFDDMREYNKTWKEVYDPEKAEGLYVLAREDGTIGSGIYRQWKRLSKKHGVPASLLLPDGENDVAEVGDFTVSLIEDLERNERVFAVVSSKPSPSGPPSDSAEQAGSNGGKGSAGSRRSDS